MALSLPIEVANTGFECTYWHIAGAQVYPREPNLDSAGNALGSIGAIDVTLCGYGDAETRRAGKSGFTLAPIRVTAAALGQATVYSFTATALYAAIKARPDWAAAVDA